MLVAPAAAPALAEHIVLAAGHILNDRVRLGVAHEGAARDLDDEILPALALTAAALPVLSVRRGVFALVAEVHQGRQVIVHPQHDAAAVAAVAAVGATRRHIFFAVEGDRAVAAAARLDTDLYLINKHFSPPRPVKKPRRVLRPQAQNKVKIIFAGGVYVGKNSARPASVEFVCLRHTNYARGRV